MPGAYRSASPSRGLIAPPRLPEAAFAITQANVNVTLPSPLYIPGSYPLTPDAKPAPPAASSYFPASSASTPTQPRASPPAANSSPLSPGSSALISTLRDAPVSPGLADYATAPSTPEGQETEPPLDAYPFPNPDAVNPQTSFDMYDDESLNTLEKIYLFSRSEASFHR
jgi:serine/threonine-protein phosphatase 4 regulatory subunit 1